MAMTYVRPLLSTVAGEASCLGDRPEAELAPPDGRALEDRIYASVDGHVVPVLVEPDAWHVVDNLLVRFAIQRAATLWIRFGECALHGGVRSLVPVNLEVRSTLLGIRRRVPSVTESTG